MTRNPLHTLWFAACCLLAACSGSGAARNTAAVDAAPSRSDSVSFDADSAYAYVKAQVDLGPRVNNTEAHRRCEELIATTLRRHGADTVVEQCASVTDHKGNRLAINNIMGRYNPDATRRILLMAHYDTRPTADAESDPQRRMMPVPGANDGASGAGVLLEIARHIGADKPDIGVDLLFVDAEDVGADSGLTDTEDTWCLGTQHWTANMPYTSADTPAFAILLDMVGGAGAQFHPEYYSVRYAPDINAKVWSMAHASGFASTFPTRPGGGVTDDHLFVNRAGIPCIDIIECNNPATGSFPPYWHTLADDMSIIDPSTLKAVGQTVLNIIYSEQPDGASSAGTK